MQTVGLKTLKNQLSQHIRTAAGGETVLVTDRGRVVAEIHPPGVRPQVAPTPEQQLAELVRRGIVTPAKFGPGAPPPSNFAKFSLDEIMRDLDESRADR